MLKTATRLLPLLPVIGVVAFACYAMSYAMVLING